MPDKYTLRPTDLGQPFSELLAVLSLTLEQWPLCW